MEGWNIGIMENLNNVLNDSITVSDGIGCNY